MAIRKNGVGYDLRLMWIFEFTCDWYHAGLYDTLGDKEKTRDHKICDASAFFW